MTANSHLEVNVNVKCNEAKCPDYLRLEYVQFASKSMHSLNCSEVGSVAV